MYIDENNKTQYGIWYDGKRKRWLSNEEIHNVKDDYEFLCLETIFLEYNKYELHKNKMIN